MPLSGDDSDPAGEVPSPTRSPHSRPPHLPPPSSRRQTSRPGREPESPPLPGLGPQPGQGSAAHARLLRTRRARPPRRAAQPLIPAPGRLPGAGLGRVGRTPAPRSRAEVNQARHKLPGAFAEASRTGRPPAPFPRGPAAAPAPTPHTRESRRRSARGPQPLPLRRPRVYLQVAAFVLEILEPLVVQFLVVRHGRAGDSFPRPGPAGSAPTTTPHRHSQEPGRRLSCNARRAAASFLLSPASAAAFSSSPRPPPPP